MILCFGHDSIMVGENFAFCISWMPSNTHSAIIDTFEFCHEKFTLPYPAPLLKEVPLLLEYPPF